MPWSARKVLYNLTGTDTTYYYGLRLRNHMESCRAKLDSVDCRMAEIEANRYPVGHRNEEGQALAYARLSFFKQIYVNTIQGISDVLEGSEALEFVNGLVSLGNIRLQGKSSLDEWLNAKEDLSEDVEEAREEVRQEVVDKALEKLRALPPVPTHQLPLHVVEDAGDSSSSGEKREVLLTSQ